MHFILFVVQLFYLKWDKNMYLLLKVLDYSLCHLYILECYFIWCWYIYSFTPHIHYIHFPWSSCPTTSSTLETQSTEQRKSSMDIELLSQWTWVASWTLAVFVGVKKKKNLFQSIQHWLTGHFSAHSHSAFASMPDIHANAAFRDAAPTCAMTHSEPPTRHSFICSPNISACYIYVRRAYLMFTF